MNTDGPLSVIWSRSHPVPRWRVTFLAFLLALSCFCIDGCAISFAYRHADWLMVHKLDQYFDLTSMQRADLTERIKGILARHRQEALPQYEAFLIEIRGRLERGLAGDDVDWFYASFDRLRDDLFERLVVDGGVFLASVEQDQARTLEWAMQNDNARAAKLASNPPQERLKKRADNTIDVVKAWTGSLSKKQRTQIIQWSQALPDSQPIFFKYRQHRQQQLLALLHRPRTSEGATRELRVALVDQDRTAPPWYRQAVEDWRAGIKMLIPQITGMLTPSQRRHAIDKLQRLINQVHDLHSG